MWVCCKDGFSIPSDDGACTVKMGVSMQDMQLYEGKMV